MKSALGEVYKGLHNKKKKFLDAFAALGNISAAATAAGISRQSHYKWLAEDINYVEAFAAAKEIAIDLLEAEARRRAIEGVDEPVYQGGKLVGTVRKYSDTLLMFLLNGERPEKYKRRSEITGANGGPIQTINHTGIDLSSVTDEELDKETKRLNRLLHEVREEKNSVR